MHSKYINSTSGRKYLTENGLRDIIFLYDVEMLAFRRDFGAFSLCMRSFDHITTSGLKYCLLTTISLPRSPI